MPVQIDSAADVVRRLQEGSEFGSQLVDSIYLPPHPEEFGDLEPPLAASLVAALETLGIERLWSHQVRGLAELRSGRNVLVTTPTASGKSLIFHLPVIAEALAGGTGRALFLYPLKALGQDQKTKLEALAAAAGSGHNDRGGLCAIYDGDTPEAERARIRKKFPRVIVSNPDMLHLGILGNWPAWEPFLRRLEWIVMDEIHTYRGIFGSHFHHVLQRLLRICRSLGTDPKLIASSATAANADEFARQLTARPFVSISESGAPRQGRHFLLFRPASSAYTLTLNLLIDLLRRGLKTIVFTKARKITELLYRWLSQQEPELAQRVANYRSGFLPEERRRIENDLFTGCLDGVISTSALEMGIDVGGLDACILVGFPGSVMATWQRSGRVGRAERESITAMVALPDALDQYFLDHPQELIERPCERLIVDPLNEPISRAHLVCAAAEQPLSLEADREYLEVRAPLVGELLRDEMLFESPDGTELNPGLARPHRDVNLRGTGETATILDSRSGRVIGTIDGIRILHECHPGAIYLHWGRQFLVRQLDLDTHKVQAEPVEVDYYTTPLTEKDTRILELLEQRRDAGLQGFLCRLQVTEKVTGFERRHVHSQETIDQHILDLPPVTYETIGLAWAAPRPIEDLLRARERHFMGALHASEHAAISLMPLYTLCDRGDIGGISLPYHPQFGCGAVFIYDGHPGGVGIAARAFAELPELLGRVAELLEECACSTGCPSCVQSPKCGNGNRPLDKDGALDLLRLLLEPEGAAAAGADSATVAIRLNAATDPMPIELAPIETTPIQDTRQPLVVETRPPSRRPALTAAAAPIRPIPTFPERTMLFDIETQRSPQEVGGWENAHKMLVAVAAVCHLQTGNIEIFDESEVNQLLALLDSADAVIGFNTVGFDYRVLSGYTGIEYAQRWPTLDLIVDLEPRLGFKPKLGDLATATLGTAKNADGERSLHWVRRGELDRVRDYCRRDVEILRDLYLHGRRLGEVLYPDGSGGTLTVTVDW